MTEVFRLDSGSSRLDKAERLDGGGYRVPANFTRVGVLEYVQPNGSVRRELRPPEEAFAPASLASYKSAPITLRHPPAGLIKSASERAALGVGHVEGEARADGEFTAGELVAWREDALKAIEERTHDRLSVGVNIRLDETPGVWNGQPYDAVQRDIRVNHVALVTHERAKGSSLRLDSSDAVSVELIERTDSQETEEKPMAENTKEIVKIRLDGKEFVFGSSEHVEHLNKARLDAEQALADEKSKSKSDLDKLQARADSAEAELKTAKEAASPERLDSLVKARAALVANVIEACGAEARTDGSDRDLMVAVVTASQKDFRADGKSDEYVRARYDHVIESKKNTEHVKDGTRLDGASLKQGSDTRLDAVAEAQKKATDYYANAWKSGGVKGAN